MNLTARVLAKLALLLSLPTAVFAQAPSPSASRWSIGAGVAAIDSPYAGEGTRLRVLPLINYEGERLFLRGITGGLHLYRSQPFTLDAIVSARLSGFDIDDLGHSELRANGLDASLLSDRDDGLDAGLRATFGLPWGAISLEAVHDISDAGGGYELSLDYRYTWQFKQTAVTANVGVSRMSSDLAGYYFGTLDEEVARGVRAYSPGSAVIPEIGLTLAHAIGASKWRLFGSIDYQFLPSKIKNSPLLEADRNGIGRMALGLSRSF